MRRRRRREQITSLAEPQLSASEELIATSEVWAARITAAPLLFRRRRLHLLALTDARLLLFSRPRRGATAACVLAEPLATLELVRARPRLLLYQVLLDAGDERRLVLEFRTRDRASGHELARTIRPARPAP
jgi:hypothetical protein